MAECNTCGGYLSIEDKIRLSMKCDANGNVVWQGALLNLNLSAEYQAYYDALTVKPSYALAVATDAFVMREVAAGRWAKLDHFISRDIAENATDAMINLIDPTKKESMSEANLQFIPYKGFVPDGVDDFVNSGYNPTTAGNKLTQNSIVEFCYFRNLLPLYAVGGHAGGNGRFGMVGKYSGTNKAGALVGNINPVYPDNSGIEKGYLFGVRPNASNASLYVNKTKYDAISYSQALPNVNLYTAGGTNGNGTLENKTKTVISMLGFGSQFTQADVEGFQDSYDALLAVVNIERTKKGVRIISDTSKKLLTIPTYVEDNNEVVHPSIIDCGAAWNGYRYWLAITPFKDRNAIYENPSIFCSNDAETWIVPPGGTNPVVPFPAESFNADPFLFFEDNKMYLGWVHQPTVKVIYLIESTDGITWSNKVAILSTAITSELTNIIPSLIKVGSIYYLYYTQTLTGDTRIVRRRQSLTIYGPYTDPEDCTFPATTGLGYNHFQVFYRNGKYYIAAATGGTSSTGDYIYMGVSTDGLTFTRDNYPVVHQTESWEWRYYTPCVVNINGQWKIYYSNIGGTTGLDDEWGLAVANLYFND